MRQRLLGIGLIVALLLTAGIAYASIPGPNGVIHGCYKTSNPGQGAVIAVDSAASCPSGFTPLNWNQTGPQGPVGPQGLSGINGVAGYQLVTDATFVPAGGSSTFWSATVLCTPGKKILGGGGTQQLNTSNVLVLVASAAAFSSGQEGWSVTYRRLSSIEFNTQIDVNAICADVGS